MLPVFKLTALSPIAVLLSGAGGILQGLIVALLILAVSSNKLEGMAVAKLDSLVLCGAAVPFFLKGNLQYVFFLLPSFWMGKAACGNRWTYMLPSFALSALWIRFLLKRYLRKL